DEPNAAPVRRRNRREQIPVLVVGDVVRDFRNTLRVQDALFTIFGQELRPVGEGEHLRDGAQRQQRGVIRALADRPLHGGESDFHNVLLWSSGLGGERLFAHAEVGELYRLNCHSSGVICQELSTI